MKSVPNIFFLTAAFAVGVSSAVKAQASIGGYGLIPLYKTTSDFDECGKGFGFHAMTPSVLPYLNPKSKKKYRDLEVRLGIGHYGAVLNKRSYALANDSCLFDFVTIKNKISGYNFSFRFSLPLENTVVPYIDLNAGNRTITGRVTNRDESYYDEIKTQQFSAGFGGGLLINFNENFGIDLGCIYSGSLKTASMLSINSGRFDANQFKVGYAQGPRNVLLIKVGISYHFYQDKEPTYIPKDTTVDTSRPAIVQNTCSSSCTQCNSAVHKDHQSKEKYYSQTNTPVKYAYLFEPEKREEKKPNPPVKDLPVSLGKTISEMGQGGWGSLTMQDIRELSGIDKMLGSSGTCGGSTTPNSSGNSSSSNNAGSNSNNSSSSSSNTTEESGTDVSITPIYITTPYPTDNTATTSPNHAPGKNNTSPAAHGNRTVMPLNEK